MNGWSDGLKSINVPRIHKLLVQQSKIMPQLHGLFIYGPDGQWIVTDKEAIPEPANNADRDYFQYHRTHDDRNVRIGEVVRSRSTDDLIIPISRRLNNPDGSFAGVLLGTTPGSIATFGQDICEAWIGIRTPSPPPEDRSRPLKAAFPTTGLWRP